MSKLAVPYPDLTAGSCVGIGVEMFYTTEDEGPQDYIDMAATIKVCESCPVREKCLEWALHHERYGIWGGTNAHQRNLMRRKMNIVVVDPSGD